MDKKMSSSQKMESYSLISKNELKCVWMTAGFLSYKLCKYNLQCEKCPLDWELRNLSSTPSFDSPTSSATSSPTHPLMREGETAGEAGEPLSNLTIKECLFYHPGHTWVKVQRANEVRVGIDDFLGRMLGKVNAVVFPLSGRRVTRGEHLCSIIQEEGILDILSPISGYILSVNQTLKDHPDRIRRDPLGEGFLLTLKPKHLQRDHKHYFSGESASSWYQKEWERLKGEAISALNPEQERLGITMQDGGIMLSDLKKIIGPDRYIRFVSSFLRKGEGHSLNVRRKNRLNPSCDLG